MIFSELYCAYYNTVAAIISAVTDGEHSEKELKKAVERYAFGESALTIFPSLKSEKWQLLHRDMTTPLKHKPTMPLTAIQKQWLKAISLDPRIRLFGVDFPALDGIEPLFTPDDYCVYDKYSDGDPYEDEKYIRHFGIILEAIRNGTPIRFSIVNKKGNTISGVCRPLRLEYSEKDDKFRVITSGWHAGSTLNVAKLVSCEHYSGDHIPCSEERPVMYDTVTVRLTDKRNALERFMLHFAHFEKQAEKLDKTHYLVKIRYAADDRHEMVIRILSFGPMVEVLGSEPFKNLFIKKLKKQFELRG